MTLMLNSFVVRGGRHVRDSGCDSMFGYFCDRGMDSRRCSRCCRPGLCLFQVVSLTLSRPMKLGCPRSRFETWDNTNARAARCADVLSSMTKGLIRYQQTGGLQLFVTLSVIAGSPIWHGLALQRSSSPRSNGSGKDTNLSSSVMSSCPSTCICWSTSQSWAGWTRLCKRSSCRYL